MKLIFLDSSGLLIPVILALAAFFAWIQWILGKLIGTNVSRMTGIIVGIVFITFGVSLVMGISCIIYSQKNANAPIDINANINNVNVNKQSSFDDTKECPYCAEIIKKNARICRHCNREL